MRIFLAGASGVIGRRLLPLLVGAGHEVAGMTRTEANVEALRDLGAQPVVCDVFDRHALCQAVVQFAPEVVVHQLTALPDDRADVPEAGAANNRIRREGTRNLLDAARAASARQVVAQSVAWSLPGDSGAAVAEHELALFEASGVVLRYGRLYGPGTYFPDRPPPPPRIRVEQAARRTVCALTAAPGVYVIEESAEDPPEQEPAAGPSAAI